RFRYKNTKARQVQSRVRMLEKMDAVEIDLIDDNSIHFAFPQAPHSGKIIFEAKKLGKAYPQKEVLKGLDFQVIRGDRIAFVGRNGEGKTTLAKIIAGQMEHEGRLQFGHQVIKGYYAQDQADTLDPEKTVFKTIDDIAVGDIRPKIRTILGSFLFSGDEPEKKVKVLSGGEKSRLSLAKLLLTPYNLLILDEPTNHLDMRSKDILKNALLQFTGTLLIVSHDRDFLQGLTNRVFEFRNQGIREYIGDIYDFLEQRRLRSLSQLDLPLQPNRLPESEETASGNKAAWERKKSQEREVRKIRTQIDRCEKEIEALENGIKETEKMLGNPEQYPEKFAEGRLYQEYEALKKRLQEELERWQALHKQLDAIPRDE
ncbi:MAG: ATP-binding cassette domain-containing protein, partial [bacterium]